MGRKKIRIWPFRFFVPLLFCSLWLYTPVFGHAAQESSGYVPDYGDIQAFLDEQDAELSFGEMVERNSRYTAVPGRLVFIFGNP